MALYQRIKYCFIGVLEGEEKECGAEIIIGNVPNLAKKHKLQLQEGEQILNMINLNKCTPRPIIVKILGTKDEEKILESRRGKRHSTQRGNHSKHSRLLIRNHKGQKKVAPYLTRARKKHLEFYTQENYPWKERETKTLSDKEGTFVSRPVLKWLWMEVF